jgi:membrane protease YdiL (CAAX protease family)
MSLSFREQVLPVHNLSKFSIGIAVFILVLFFLVAGPLIFAETWGVWQNVFIVYLFFMVAGILFAREAFEISAIRWLLVFAVAAVGGYFAFSFVLPKYDAGFPTGNFLALLAFSFTVAYSEETLFRGVLLEFGKSRVGLGVVISALFFAIFHVAAYAGLGIVPFLVALAMGSAFGFIYLATRSLAGTAVVVGLHMAWNLALLLG